jgi:hypothetical protein
MVFLSLLSYGDGVAVGLDVDQFGERERKHTTICFLSLPPYVFFILFGEVAKNSVVDAWLLWRIQIEFLSSYRSLSSLPAPVSISFSLFRSGLQFFFFERAIIVCGVNSF